MTLIEEALKLADDIAEYAPNTNIETVIRRLVVELKLRDAVKLKIDNSAEEPQLIRVKKKK